MRTSVDLPPLGPKAASNHFDERSPSTALIAPSPAIWVPSGFDAAATLRVRPSIPTSLTSPTATPSAPGPRAAVKTNSSDAVISAGGGLGGAMPGAHGGGSGDALGGGGGGGEVGGDGGA